MTDLDFQKLIVALAVLLAVIVLFVAIYVRRRRSRGAKGDFASLLAKEDVQAALRDHAVSAAQDAAAALADTKQALRKVTAYGRRLVSLVWAVFAACLCGVCAVFVVVVLTDPAGIAWVTAAVLLVLGALAGWFARDQWRSFRASVGAHFQAMEEERWFMRWLLRKQ